MIVSIYGKEYEVYGYIEPRDVSVGILCDAFILERLVPRHPSVTQAEADALCNRLCEAAPGTDDDAEYLRLLDAVEKYSR